jgi:hypothetical protein
MIPIPIRIPIGVEFTAIRQGSKFKPVTCELCGQEYGYFLDLAVQSQETSYLFLDEDGAKQRAADQANQKLAEALKSESGVAPCPKCGQIQQHMFRTARRERPCHIMFAGVVVLCLGGLFTLYTMFRFVADRTFTNDAPVYWLILGSIFALGMVMIVGEWIHVRRWNPNSQPLQARLTLAASRSLTKEAYLEMLKKTKT